jgi:hypothetical protein
LEANRASNQAEPHDYETLGIPGFGLSGSQYLRILFGAQAVKPDVHIRRFVSEAVGRPVQDVQALVLLEAASKRLGWPLSSLDYAIWEELARGTREGKQCIAIHRSPGTQQRSGA